MKENQNRKNWIFALILVLIIVCVLCGILMFELIATKKINPIQNVSLNTEAVAIEDAETEQDMIYFSGFDDITVELGYSIMLPCDTGNKDGSIYMNYTVLDEKGKSLFDSGLIEPGKAVEWFPSLTVGEYDICLIIVIICKYYILIILIQVMLPKCIICLPIVIPYNH